MRPSLGLPKSIRTATLLAVCFALETSMAGAPPAIVFAPDAPPRVRFAAREVQRYVYLRTGELPALTATAVAPRGPAIVVATREEALAQPGPFASAQERDALTPESYLLRTTADGRTWIVGGGDLGTLYGAYRFAERLGVRFYLHGDVVPDERLAGAWPALDETGRPLFAVRGLQPFHDFAEGPDWWNRDDYRAVVGQMAKLRMNFLGLHTYPESSVGPEPTVWIGTRGEYDEGGRVTRAYPASYHTTGRSGRSWWGYEPMRTSEFTAGAAALFERDDFGGEVMRDHAFAGQTPASAAEVFNRTADLLRDAFTEARRFGLKTCVGTETPLVVPDAVRERLRAAGRDPDDPAVTGEIYAAMFDRIARAYPIDYYWLWTPENWTWEGNKPDQFAATAADIRAALRALDELGRPFTLATCGWVLGPQHDRAALDHLLPPDSPMSAINQSVGHRPIDRQFANLSARPRWAIPWLENDGALIQPQLWAGRMRFDAADALRLGCDGLLGIHWRTRVLAPNLAALAGAMWDQSWLPASFDPSRLPPQTASGAIGGSVLEAAQPAAGADEAAAILATAREGMEAYEIPVPNGAYTLTLAFSDPAAASPGRRVFTVRLDGVPLLERLDLAVATQRHVYTHVVTGHRVNSGKVRLDFEPVAGQPVISGITIEGATEVNNAPYRRSINCGGPALAGHEADRLPGTARPDESRTMPVDEFYRDFASANFGTGAGPGIGTILARVDGKLHQTIGWLDGPGGITRHTEPWEALAPQYAFIDELERQAAEVAGAGNRARFEAWLAQFRTYRALARIGCAAGALDRAVQQAVTETAAPARREFARAILLPQRLALTRAWEELLALQISASDTTGELGILANLEQHNRLQQKFLTRHDETIASLLEAPLPPGSVPSMDYVGPDRIIVPTVRTSGHPGESLSIRVLLAGRAAPTEARLSWRPLGAGEFQSAPLELVARRVYRATLPPLTTTLPAIEYRIEARFGSGPTLRWPAGEHGHGQTVVLFEAE